MKRPVTASLAFKKSKPSVKPAFGESVITSLIGAADQFPELPVPTSRLKATNAALASAVSEALTGNHQAIAQLRATVNEWNDEFTKTANYVSTVASGSDIVIRSAGFVPTKGETTRAQKPVAVANFNATINGSKGAIIAGSKNAVPQAKAYVYVAAQDGVHVSYNNDTVVIQAGDKNIYIIADTQKQTEFFNLPSGTAFNVNMYALNSAGSGPASTAKQVVTQ